MMELIKELRHPDSPRVLNAYMVGRLLTGSSATKARKVAQASEAGLIIKVRAGLYMNSFSKPAVALAECAGWIRPGCVVSLQTVLGDAGILHNYTPDVFAVLGTEIMTSGGSLRSHQGWFHFKRLSPRYQYAGRTEDRFDMAATTYERATPEKALMDWIALGKSPRSTMTPPPPMDIEFDDFDQGRLERLSRACGFDGELDALRKAHEGAWRERELSG